MPLFTAPARGSADLPARHPIIAELDVRSLYCGPSYAMGGLFLPAFTSMRFPGVIERLAINILRMDWQMHANRGR
jgi:hypothetical protein